MRLKLSMLLSPMGLLRLIPTGRRHGCARLSGVPSTLEGLCALAPRAVRETGLSTLKNPQDRICCSHSRDQSHQKASQQEGCSHPCSSQHAAGSGDGMEPMAASFHPAWGWPAAAPPPPWAALLTPSISFFLFYNRRDIFKNFRAYF